MFNCCYGRIKLTENEPLRDNIVTFFYQGNGASRSQGAQYTGPEGISVISNNEIIHSVPTK